MATGTRAKHTSGTKIYLGDGATPEIFTKIPECIGVAKLGQSRPTVKVTYSDADAEEYIGGRRDGDEQEWRFNYDSADPTQASLITKCDLGDNFNLRVTVPNYTTKIYGYTVTPLNCDLDPSNIDGQQVLVFRCKMSGTLDRNASL